MDPINSPKSIWQAESDLTDISTLRKTAAFQRYFLRRLKERCDALSKSVLEEDLRPEEREIYRRMYLEYKELIVLIDKDESNAKKIVQG